MNHKNTEEISEAIDEHLHYWKNSAARTFEILTGGLSQESSYHLLVIESEDRERIIEFAKNDPIIKADKGFRFEIEDILPPNCEQYYREVAKPLIAKYEGMEKKKKLEFFGWQIAILIVGVTITIVNAVPLVDNPWVRVLSSILGASVAVMTGITQLLRAHDLWVLFGTWYIRLASEWNLYKYGAGVYSKLTPQEGCKEFVKNFEALRMEAGLKSWTIAGKKEEG